MSLGEYVEVKVPSSNKIVAGLVEEIIGNSAIVRLRSSTDAAANNRDATITVPRSSLRPLGVFKSDKINDVGKDEYHPSSPGSPGAEFLRTANDSGDFGEEDNIYNNNKQNGSGGDPFKNFDSGNIVVNPTISKDSTVLATENSSPSVKEYKRNEATASFYRHGIFSRFVWEFLSPISRLLKCDSPMFTIGFLILAMMADLIRQRPDFAVEATCFMTSRIIRGFDFSNGKTLALPPPSSSVYFSSFSPFSATTKESSSSAAATSVPDLNTKEGIEKIFASHQNNNNENEKAKQKQNTKIATEKVSETTTEKENVVDALVNDIDYWIETKILFPFRLFLRDAGLFVEDLMFSVQGSSINIYEKIVGQQQQHNHNQKYSRTSSTLGYLCQRVATSKNFEDEFRRDTEIKKQVRTVSGRLMTFIYFIMVCFLWTGSVRCEPLPTDSSASSSADGSHKKEDNKVENLVQKSEVEEENRLLDDASDGEQDENVENEQQQQQQGRLSFKLHSDEYYRQHRRLRKLEIETHYPDVALRRFLKENKGVVLIHLFIIAVVCVFSWFVRIVEAESPGIGSPDKKYFRVVYANSVAQTFLGRFEKEILTLAAEFGQPLEQWLLQSLSLNAFFSLIGYFIGRKWRK